MQSDRLVDETAIVSHVLKADKRNEREINRYGKQWPLNRVFLVLTPRSHAAKGSETIRLEFIS